MVGAIGDNSDDSLKMTTIFQQVTINQFTTITTMNQVRFAFGKENIQNQVLL